MKEWEVLARELCTEPGLAIVLGTTDVGKTTLTVRVANMCLEYGRKVAIVDADMGQSDIGPPTTVGMSVLETPVAKMSEGPLTAAYFVGSTSPEQVLLEAVTGVCKMAGRARAAGAEVVLVDTTGLVWGRLGRTLKHYKIELVDPHYLVALEKERELEHILRPFLGRERPAVRRLPVAAEARRKSFEQRKELRENRFARHFAGATEFDLDLREVAVSRGFLGSGFRMDTRQLLRLSAGLDSEIVYAERLPEGLYVVTRGAVSGLALSQFQKRAGARHLISVAEEDFSFLLVGLVDRQGDFLALGIITGTDFRRGVLRVLSPCPSPGAVAGVELGLLRVEPEGRELGRVPAGAL